MISAVETVFCDVVTKLLKVTSLDIQISKGHSPQNVSLYVSTGWTARKSGYN